MVWAHLYYKFIKIGIKTNLFVSANKQSLKMLFDKDVLN